MEDKKQYKNLKPYKPFSECTEEEIAKRQENLAKARAVKEERAKIRRETLDRGAIVDEALVDLMNEDPEAMKKLNKRLLAIIGSDDAKDGDVTKAISLFADINQLKAPKNASEAEQMKPKTKAEREEALQRAGVRIVK